MSSGGGNGSGGTKSAGSGSGGRSGGQGLWAAYLAELDKRPVITKMWTSGLINGIGDILAQNLFSDGPFDKKRFVVFTALGLILIGPTLHHWYGLLSRIFVASGVRSAIGSLFLDQAAFAPCLCATILSLLVVAETGKVSSIKPKLDDSWASTVVMNWKIWIPAQLINFWVVPPNLRVFFANMVALIWTTYLSYASHKTSE